MAETMQLSHINTPPAQTWNYLRVNDIALEVPVPIDHGAAFNRLPRVFDGIECGLGDEAVDWIVSSVPEARYIEVPAHSRREDPIVVVATSGENAYSDTGVCIREGAEATVVVAASADPSGDAITAALTRIIVERGATAHIVEVVAHGGANRHLEGLGIDAGRVKSTLALFGSSSPSWLILQSLDACNPYLETLPDRLAAFLPGLERVKAALTDYGYALTGDEPMKLTIRARAAGYTGDALAAALAE